MKKWFKWLCNISIIAFLIKAIYKIDTACEKQRELAARKGSYYTVLCRWLNNRNSGKSIADYLISCDVNSIAIYGMGELGTILYDELINDGRIRVAYMIDGAKFGIGNIIKIEEIKKQEMVDAIIITPFYDYESINNELKSLYEGQILGLEKVIFRV